MVQRTFANQVKDISVEEIEGFPLEQAFESGDDYYLTAMKVYFYYESEHYRNYESYVAAHAHQRHYLPG